MQRLSLGVARFFSSFREAADKFAGVLGNELAYEKTHYAFESSTQDFLITHQYSLAENEQGTHMTLTRSVSKAEIEVTFLAKPSEFLITNPSIDLKTEGDSEADLEDIKFLIVKIKDKTTGKGMLAKCSIEQGELKVGTMAAAPNIDEFPKFTANDRSDAFQGPEFRLYDKKLSEALNDCVSDLVGMPELAKFIEVYGKDKEQRLYMGWLKQTQDFFKSNENSAE
mmetsp:Transcript_20366/g.38094  ORF Transcript_20366/g.38094 Transcript_20366/m.38094 type:complete len:225 (-) Transcript_20366:2886-3560(-)